MRHASNNNKENKRKHCLTRKRGQYSDKYAQDEEFSHPPTVYGCEAHKAAEHQRHPCTIRLHVKAGTAAGYVTEKIRLKRVIYNQRDRSECRHDHGSLDRPEYLRFVEHQDASEQKTKAVEPYGEFAEDVIVAETS